MKSRRSKYISEVLFIWALGGTIYYTIEMVTRGFSHWSMFVVGGLALCFCTFQGQAMKWTEPLWIQVIKSVVFVTSLEFITGIIVNKWLGMQVWDYSELPFQLLGQICLPFMVIFSGLCVLGIFLSSYIGYLFYGEEKPRFILL